MVEDDIEGITNPTLKDVSTLLPLSGIDISVAFQNNSSTYKIDIPITHTQVEGEYGIHIVTNGKGKNPGIYISEVTFDSNGGSVSQTTKTVTYTHAYGELPTPTRDGHTFTDWYTQLTEGVKTTKDTEVTTPSNHTLYAMWEANTYIVTFDATGGNTPSPQTKSVTYGKTYGTLPTTSKSNYNFLGWYTASSGGSKISSSSTVNITSDIKLYAHWEKKVSSKTFSGDLYNWTGTSHSEYGSKHSISGHTKYELKYEQEGGNPNPDYGVVNLYYYKGGTKYKLDNGKRTGGHASGTLKGDIPSGATHLQVRATGYTGDVSYTLKVKP